MTVSESPAAALIDPTASDPVPDLLENVIGISQYISLSYWISEAIELTLGTNPAEWVAQEFAGDWEKVQKAGIALENLAEFSAAYSDVITSELEAVSSRWQGNAADSANSYFSGLARTVHDHQATLNSMGQEFKQSAIGMYETANAIQELLATLFDYLLAIGLELAAAATAGWTVVGPILAGAAAAATIGRALGVWDDILKAHTAAWTAAQGLVGVMAGYLSALGGVDQHALPESTYNHPGV